MDFGTFGVVLFFTLSGYTLCLSNPRPWSGLGKFYVRRLFRVYPTFLVSIPIYLTLAYAVKSRYGFDSHSWLNSFAYAPNLKVLAEYLTFTFNFGGNWSYINNVYWSLPVEFQFYVLFPLLLVVVQRSRLAAVISAMVLAMICSHLELTSLTLQLVWQFVCGMVLARLLERRPLHPRPFRSAVLGIGAAALVYTAAFHIDWFPSASAFSVKFFAEGSSLYYGVAAWMTIYVVRQFEGSLRKGAAFASLLEWNGQLSYSLYIFHNAALLICYAIFTQWHLEGNARLVVIYGIGIPLAYLFARLSYQYVELRGIRLGKQLATSHALRSIDRLLAAWVDGTVQVGREAASTLSRKIAGST